MKKELINKFLNYVSFDTQSDEESTTVPSTLKQRLLGEELVKELKAIGIDNAYIDEYGYVYGYLPSNKETNMTIGLIAHQDTATELTGKDVKPNVIEAYDGNPIYLKNNYVLDPKEFTSLNRQKGHTIITTDGTTLLGADDKAGITIIM